MPDADVSYSLHHFQFIVKDIECYAYEISTFGMIIVFKYVYKI